MHRKYLLFFCLVVALNVKGQSFSFTTLASFHGTNGATPRAPLLLAADGNVYGTTAAGGASSQGVVFKVPPFGLPTLLYSFSGGDDGATPRGALVQASDGWLYGTTRDGGTNGLGTIFAISTNGSFASLYSFSGTDGSHPYAGLIRGGDGNFYGTTYDGGANDMGIVFEFDTNHSFRTVYTFGGLDGANPYAGVVWGADGNLYGTTLNGGPYVDGTLFQLATNGVLNQLYAFSGGYDGGTPFAGVIQSPDGNIRGTTYYAGGGYGAAYQLVPPANTWFNGANGANPKAGVTLGPNNLYYTVTENGGTNNTGALAQIATSGAITLIHSFSGGADGGNPVASLIWDGGVNFYGTTPVGGSDGVETLFRLTIVSPPTNFSTRRSGNLLSMQWQVIPGQNYQMQYLTDLASTNWQNLGGTVMATNAMAEWGDTITESNGFYRLILVVP